MPVWGVRGEDEGLVWKDLCDAAGRLGLEVRLEILTDEARTFGGLVRLGERRFILIEERLPQDVRNQTLMEILRDYGVEGIYLPPYLRKRMDSQ